MDHLITLRHKDIFPADFVVPKKSIFPIERIAVRIIAIDEEGCIALCGTKYELLPGGGVDERETFEESAMREAKEEIGCDVEIINEIGTSEEWRYDDTCHQVTHCFLAKVIGEKQAPTTTQEDEVGIKVYWYRPKETLKILENQARTIPFESYNASFNVRTSKAFVEKYISDFS